MIDLGQQIIHFEFVTQTRHVAGHGTVAEAEQQCATAAIELARQYRERLAFREDLDLETLPFEAQDLSLSALTATVLRAYDGVQGGFLLSGRVLGRAASGTEETLPLSAIEERLLRATPAGATELLVAFESAQLDLDADEARHETPVPTRLDELSVGRRVHRTAAGGREVAWAGRVSARSSR